MRARGGGESRNDNQTESGKDEKYSTGFASLANRTHQSVLNSNDVKSQSSSDCDELKELALRAGLVKTAKQPR